MYKNDFLLLLLGDLRLDSSQCRDGFYCIKSEISVDSAFTPSIFQFPIDYSFHPPGLFGMRRYC